MGKIGIIGAMEEEVMILREKLVNLEEVTIASAEFYVGELAGKEVVLLKSGIGKVNATLSTTLLCDHYDISLIINTGSAGGIGAELEVGDVIISDNVAYGDVDATVFGYTYGQVPQMPAQYQGDVNAMQLAQQVYQDNFSEKGKAVYGLVVTTDSFIHRPDQREMITTFFPEVKAVEMEACAIAQVAHQFDVPFLIIRALSDVADSEASVSFDEFLATAAANSSTCILQLLAQL
ncbi:5'-methylthioadenosine/S-adenosylhomocysteine nucleosidase [Listeria booriae]|uniref:5'-methylthioadenosine/S-adenosylhomocysteine nucleosidase n=1 Tax=Listeria booriae TaxID=1552123 RepID=UPI0016252B61|nr:5'-methylthioadenosine/S-adenosylhomocysteine nucleosidase [Listeria booriae]MBC1230029.1 5'-methylthioadenosine/S-adenosylhomocysteine nucleosidase [Listeria booriae]